MLVASSALSGHCLLVENAYGTTGSSSNCQLTYEEIPTQKCTPEPGKSVRFEQAKSLESFEEELLTRKTIVGKKNISPHLRSKLSHVITFSAESCAIVDFPSDDVEYKRVCKDVTSVHCPTTRRSKREAEADPQWSAVPLSSSAWPWASNTRFQPLFQFQNAVPARYPASTATFLYPGSYKPLATPQV